MLVLSGLNYFVREIKKKIFKDREENFEIVIEEYYKVI